MMKRVEDWHVRVLSLRFVYPILPVITEGRITTLTVPCRGVHNRTLVIARYLIIESFYLSLPRWSRCEKDSKNNTGFLIDFLKEWYFFIWIIGVVQYTCYWELLLLWNEKWMSWSSDNSKGLFSVVTVSFCFHHLSSSDQ